MKAFVLKEKSSTELLALQECPKPQPKPGQVLIKTKAVSLNPVDYKVTQGVFDLKTPIVIGIDVAGEIVEVGAGVSHLAIGDRVFAMVNIFETGSFAEFVAVDAIAVSKMPQSLGFNHAATIPCAGVTAWQAVMEKINLRKGQTVFITAGGGGVGGFAIQFAKMKGATVITSASKDFDRIKALGADYVINYKTANVQEEVLKITRNAGVDYMIDAISGTHAAEHANMLRFNGCIVCITGLPAEYPFPPFSKAAGMIEVALVAAYNCGDKNALKEVALAGEQIARLIDEDQVESNITQTIKFEEIVDALKDLSQGHAAGKVVAVC